MFGTVKFNIFEEHLEEIVYGKKSQVQTVKVEIIQPLNEQINEQTSLQSANQNYKHPVFRRFDWEREGTLNTL